jgi:hypothetical protein
VAGVGGVMKTLAVCHVRAEWSIEAEIPKNTPPQPVTQPPTHPHNSRQRLFRLPRPRLPPD